MTKTLALTTALLVSLVLAGPPQQAEGQMSVTTQPSGRPLGPPQPYSPPPTALRPTSRPNAPVAIKTVPIEAKPIRSPRTQFGLFTYPPHRDTFRRLTPQMPQWPAWWEANRDLILEFVRQGHDKPSAETLANSAKFRKQAVDSLFKALRSDSPVIRGSAALSLGQMGEETAIASLIALAKNDKDVRVRQAAILAVGLLDVPRGEAFLAELAFAPMPSSQNGWRDKPTDRQAAFIAMGLMTRVSPHTAVKIQKTTAFPLAMQPLSAWALTRPLDPLDPTAPKYRNWSAGINGDKDFLARGSSLAISAISLWAMAWQDDPAVAKLCRDALGRTNMPWTAAEAIVTLGQRGGEAAIGGLTHILHATPTGQFLPAYKTLDLQHQRLAYLWQVRLSAFVRKDYSEVETTGRWTRAVPDGDAFWTLIAVDGVNAYFNTWNKEERAQWSYWELEPGSQLPPKGLLGGVVANEKGSVTAMNPKATVPYEWNNAGIINYTRASYAVFDLFEGKPEFRAGNRVYFPQQKHYLQLHYGGENCDAVTLDIGRTDRNGRPLKTTMHDFSWYFGEWGSVARINLGVEPIMMANLRASAAIALGRINTPESNSALWRVLTEKVDKKVDNRVKRDGKSDVEVFDNYDYSLFYKSQAIMSLGQLGDEKSVPILVAILKPPPPTAPKGRAVTREQKEEHADQLRSPLRGFAALALGLYCRPILVPQVPERGGYGSSEQEAKPVLVDRKNTDNISKLLAEIMADRREAEDLRAACALALALGGRTENLKYFYAAAKTVDKSNELLFGYMTLARGMLGDKSILDAAGAFLAVKNNRTDRDGILARRAVALGIGMTGSSRAVEPLVDALSLGRYVTRESAFALSFCQGHGPAAEKLLAGLNNAKASPQDRALLARCLGDLFAAECPSRMTRLSADSNYDMRIPRLATYRAFASEFLFTYLLAPPADEWETLMPGTGRSRE